MKTGNIITFHYEGMKVYAAVVSSTKDKVVARFPLADLTDPHGTVRVVEVELDSKAARASSWREDTPAFVILRQMVGLKPTQPVVKTMKPMPKKAEDA